jgi:hypothetical protein
MRGITDGREKGTIDKRGCESAANERCTRAGRAVAIDLLIPTRVPSVATLLCPNLSSRFVPPPSTSTIV